LGGYHLQIFHTSLRHVRYGMGTSCIVATGLVSEQQTYIIICLQGR
jgi:hypothetical protein